MTDNGMQGRVMGHFGGPDESHYGQMDATPDPTAQHQSLQVLTLAQRTAEEHIANAQHQADKICADARAMAEKIVREAQMHAHELRQEAEQSLSDAHAGAAQIAREAQAHAEAVQQNAEEILADARARADEFIKNAEDDAEELNQRAQQHYDDVVGSLSAKREALQQQIEALEEFDRDYRTRLMAFMQNQLRALWVDQPHLDGELVPSGAVITMPVPAQQQTEDRS